MKILKELFETINKEAFKLKSVKEIYTRTLSPEELDDNNIDFISGFQVIDQNLRITILEGITGKAINLIKEKLPKLELNTEKRKIFSNSKILFNKRIYSSFNLCLKFIKLRNPLSQILNTADIYLKANKYREIFNAFMQLGFILQSPTFESITNANLFPTFESLEQLERKYADIINDEDLSGIKSEKKKKKKLMSNNNSEKIQSTNSALSTENNVINNSFNNNNIGNSRISGSANNNNNLNSSFNINNNSNSNNVNSFRNKSPVIKSKSSRKDKRNPKLDSYNNDFIKKKKEEIGKSMSFNRKENFIKTHKINCEHITKLNQKNSNSHHFWVYEKMTPIENIINVDNEAEEKSFFENININSYNEMNNIKHGTNSYLSTFENENNRNKQNTSVQNNSSTEKKDNELYMYSQQRNNMFNKHLNELREKVVNDKDNYYTYSMDHLTLSFPNFEERNEEYLKFVENKKVIYESIL